MSANLNSTSCFFCQKTPDQLTKKEKKQLGAFKTLQECFKCYDAWYCSEAHQVEHIEKICTKYIFSQRQHIYYSFLEQLRDKIVKRRFTLKEDEKSFHFTTRLENNKLTLYLTEKDEIDKKVVKKIKQLAEDKKLEFVQKTRRAVIIEFCLSSSSSGDELVLSDLEPPTFD